jgi:hypothetical protein
MLCIVRGCNVDVVLIGEKRRGVSGRNPRLSSAGAAALLV